MRPAPRPDPIDLAGAFRIGDPDLPDLAERLTDTRPRVVLAAAGLWCTGFLHGSLGVVMLVPGRDVIVYIVSVLAEITANATGVPFAPGAVEGAAAVALAIGLANLVCGAVAFGGGVALALGERWGAIVGAVASAAVVPTWLVPPTVILMGGLLAGPRWIDLQGVLAFTLALAVPAILATATALVAATAPGRIVRADHAWAEECERDARQLAG